MLNEDSKADAETPSPASGAADDGRNGSTAATVISNTNSTAGDNGSEPTAVQPLPGNADPNLIDADPNLIDADTEGYATDVTNADTPGLGTVSSDSEDDDDPAGDAARGGAEPGHADGAQNPLDDVPDGIYVHDHPRA